MDRPALYWALAFYLVSFILFTAMLPVNEFARLKELNDFLFITVLFLLFLVTVLHHEKDAGDRRTWLFLFYAAEWLLMAAFGIYTQMHHWKPDVFGAP